MSLPAIEASTNVDGVEWRVRLVPLEAVEIWSGGKPVEYAAWDRQTLYAAGVDVPMALTHALREAIRASDRT